MITLRELRAEIDELHGTFPANQRTASDYRDRRQELTEKVLNHLATTRNHYGVWVIELLRMYKPGAKHVPSIDPTDS